MIDSCTLHNLHFYIMRIILNLFKKINLKLKLEKIKSYNHILFFRVKNSCDKIFNFTRINKLQKYNFIKFMGHLALKN